MKEIKYPVYLEKANINFFRNFVNKLIKITTVKAFSYFGRLEHIRLDSVWNKKHSFLDVIEKKFLFFAYSSKNYFKKIALKINAINTLSFERLDKSKDKILSKKIDELISLWVLENVSLVKGISSEHLRKIHSAVIDSFLSKKSKEDLTNQIKTISNATKSKAKLIASDQLSKLQSSVNRNRAVAHGKILYVWRTAKDERVRHSHKVLEGKVCSFLDSNTYQDDVFSKVKQRSSISATTHHIGSDFNCRCTPIIVN